MPDSRFCSNTCQLGCESESCRAAGCDSPAYGIANISPRTEPFVTEFDENKYCSLNCAVVSQLDRRGLRAVLRLDDIVNEAFMEASEAINVWHLDQVTCGRIDGKLCLHAVEKCSAREEIDHDDPATKEYYEDLVSFNHCVKSTFMFSGILTFLMKELALNIEFEEIFVKDVKATRKITCVYDGSGKEEEVAPMHTRIRIIPSSNLSAEVQPNLHSLLADDGIYLNPTARQYGDDPGYAKVSSYGGTEHRAYEIGSTYNAMLEEMHGKHDTTIMKIEKDLHDQAVTSTFNESFLKAFKDLGGADVFRKFDNSSHKAAKDKLILEMTAGVERAQTEFFTIYLEYNPEEEEQRVTHLREFVQECVQPGHLKIVRELERDDMEGEKLVLYYRGMRLGEIIDYDAEAEKDYYEVLVSFNHCVKSVMFFAGILTFIKSDLQLNIQLCEADVKDTQASVEVSIYHRDEEEDIAWYHTMIQILPDPQCSADVEPSFHGILGDGGVYLNPTARQYGQTPGYSKVKPYPGIFVSAKETGYHYYDNLANLPDTQTAEHQVTVLYDEAIARILNNTFYDNFMNSGGAKMFFSYDDASYEAAKEALIVAIVQAVTRLRDHLVDVLHGYEPGDQVRSLKDLVRDCEGSGHLAIAQELERASSLPIMSLQDIP